MATELIDKIQSFRVGVRPSMLHQGSICITKRMLEYLGFGFDYELKHT